MSNVKQKCQSCNAKLKVDSTVRSGFCKRCGASFYNANFVESNLNRDSWQTPQSTNQDFGQNTNTQNIAQNTWQSTNTQSQNQNTWQTNSPQSSSQNSWQNVENSNSNSNQPTTNIQANWQTVNPQTHSQPPLQTSQPDNPEFWQTAFNNNLPTLQAMGYRNNTWDSRVFTVPLNSAIGTCPFCKNRADWYLPKDSTTKFMCPFCLAGINVKMTLFTDKIKSIEIFDLGRATHLYKLGAIDPYLFITNPKHKR
ncbi:MAG: hypothetical protein FWE13_02505 [Firmicutes bacterium]|nr:hypothetical protein [Bacillota bacterium]